METLELIISLVLLYIILFGMIALILFTWLYFAKKKRNKEINKQWYYKVKTKQNERRN